MVSSTQSVSSLPGTKGVTSFKAYHLAEKLKLSVIRKSIPEEPLSASGRELVYDFGDKQIAIIYNFGSIVFYNVSVERQERILLLLTKHQETNSLQVTSEDYFVAMGPDLFVDFNRITLPEFKLEYISIVSLVLARSAALDYFERTVDEVLYQSGPISEDLEKRGRISKSDKEITKFIGFCMSTKQKLLSATYLLDSPDPTWEDPLLSKIFIQLSDQFELRERYKTLEHKLEFIQDMQEILSDLSYSRRSLFLEISIVAMIALEIFLGIYRFLDK